MRFIGILFLLISCGSPQADEPVVEKDTVNVTEAVSPTPVDFSYGDTQTGMMDAAATLRSPFTNQADRTAAQDYISGIVSNIRMPF